MIFCKDLLFIHIPKTGGMSLTKLLLEVLPRPVYYVTPHLEPELDVAGIVQIRGNRHETVAEARQTVARFGAHDLEHFAVILAVLRNPYDLEVSRYAYLRKGNPWDRGYNQDLALNNDFETFAIESRDHGDQDRPIQSYLLDGDRLPGNLHIVRLEDFEHGVKNALRHIGVETTAQLPWINRSLHHDHRAYYTKQAELAVYQRYRWLFDNGYYERMQCGALSLPDAANLYGPDLFGPVRQVGVCCGYWPDKWVGTLFEARIQADEPISEISIEGWLPEHLPRPCNISLSLGEQQITRCFDAYGDFEWRVPYNFAPGTLGMIQIGSSTSWSPYERGLSRDARQLSFVLRHITFNQMKSTD